MADAKLKFGDNEIALNEGVTTLGRTTDNMVSFAADSNVSRYHAEIEWRDGDYWLIDLGSSNGTNLNGEALKSDVKLSDGDEIVFGGTSRAEFSSGEKDEESETAAAAKTDSDAKANDANKKVEPEPPSANSRMPLMLGIAGVAVGLAVVCVIGVVIYSYSGSSATSSSGGILGLGATKCEAKAVITKPDDNETITEKTEIEVETENADCASRAIFLINGAEFASADQQPFSATIDPKQFPEFADGSLQSLKIVLEDAEGNKIVQPSEISLAFETIEIAAPTPTSMEVAENPTPKPTKGEQKISGTDVQETSRNLLKEFSGTNIYKFDAQFLQEIQKKTAEYASEGYYARASAYKDVISVAFVQERNLDASLGFILAMSRSGFKPQKQGAEEGLWQMNPSFVAENGYNGLCGTETLTDASQNCAAKAASLYLKALVLEVFEGDVIYSVAAFGKSPQEANIWKATLPADRTDFWRIIKDPKQREQVARFFAAGVVAENPQKFGLKKDRPISELYKNLVGN